MTSQQGRAIQDLDVEGIGFDHHILPGPVHRYGVAIGLVGHQAVSVEPGRCGDTTVVGKRGQAAQHWALLLPHLPNGLSLSADPPAIVLETRADQLSIQFLEAGSLRNGHKKVPATKAHTCLNTTFLPPGGWLAEMTFKQVVRAKGDKSPLFSPHPTFHHEPYSS